MEKTKEQVQQEQQAIAALTSKGLSEEMATFVVGRNNRALNNEGLSVGDIFTIEGIDEKPSEFVTDDGETRQFANVLTSGDRDTISIGRLVGTNKRATYFGANYKEQYPNILELPRREGDALVEILANYIGKTVKVVAEAESKRYPGQYYYLFEVQG